VISASKHSHHHSISPRGLEEAMPERREGAHLLDELLSPSKRSSCLQRDLLILVPTDDVDPALLCRRVMREVDSAPHRRDLLVGGDPDVGTDVCVRTTGCVGLQATITSNS
jgi:hypothetical protein